MLKRLTIQNYALIEALDIPFPDHLIIITGETGAGKSILLGALSLLLGGKSDISVLKDKSRNCIVEAEFNTPDELLVRRVITPQGRSRFFINDEPVSLEEVKNLGSSLVDIHSQNSHSMLADKQFQLSVLDSFAGNDQLLNEYSELFVAFQEALSRLKSIDEQIAEQEKNRDYTEFQYNRLNEVKLVAGEMEELDREHNELANAEEIKNSLSQVISLFDNGEVSVSSVLKEIEAILQKCRNYLPELDQFVQRISSSRIELKDVEEEVEARQEKVEVSPDRLQKVEERLAVLYELLRKYGKEKVEDLIELRNEFEKELALTDNNKEQREELKRKCDELDTKCAGVAKKLHDSRVAKAPLLAKQIENQIKYLEIEHAVFKVEVGNAGSRGKDGYDNVLFYFSANGDSALKELSKCASGGEMSRIMLCIKAIMAKNMGMPTMIFDEIDTGVSGSIADKMGSMIVRMGDDMQVLAITHLPQVASKGTVHYLVTKSFGDNNEAKTNISEISGETRVLEIARMLSGSRLTDEAIANARVLLSEK